MMLNQYIWLILFFLFGCATPDTTLPKKVKLKQYDFINYEKNYLQFFEDSSKFEQFFARINEVSANAKGKINIAHIGDSHIQADIFTGQVRYRLQTFLPNMNGGRGCIFPYKAAHTNNPADYITAAWGNWETSKIVSRKIIGELGLAGISVTTHDPKARLQISFPSTNQLDYKFNRVKLFHDFGIENFDVVVKYLPDNAWVQNYEELGYSEYFFDSICESLDIQFSKTSRQQKKYTLYGIILENDNPGIVYNSFGVNSAEVTSFLKPNLLPKHLAALNPNLTIISLGTNDAYSTKFDSLKFENNYDLLIKRIIVAVPNSAIILTVPGDDMLPNKKINHHTTTIRNVLMRLAKAHRCAVWDFYTVMGGKGSINDWFDKGLSTNGKVHLTESGYKLQGDLFYEAIEKAYTEFTGIAHK